MHLGSTYLIPSKPKDFPIHFMLPLYVYVQYIHILRFIFSVHWHLYGGRCPFADRLVFLWKVTSALAKHNCIITIQNQLKCFSSKSAIQLCDKQINRDMSPFSSCLGDLAKNTKDIRINYNMNKVQSVMLELSSWYGFLLTSHGSLYFGILIWLLSENSPLQMNT